MNILPGRCPICGSGEVIVTRFRCDACDTSIEGRFVPERGAFAQLSAEQMRFVEMFVKCEGKLNRMEVEMDLSYPTIRARLTEVIRRMGYEPGRDEPELRRPGGASGAGGTGGAGLSEAERRRVLDDLEAGRISPEQAMQQLGG